MFNLGDMLDAIGGSVEPDRPALIHGDRRLDWGAFSAQSNRLARALLGGGPAVGDKVAIYLRNGPEYLVALAAALKARMVPVNVNYRYADAELAYLLDNADARCVIYAAEFRGHVEAIRAELPDVALWIEVGVDDAPAFARRFADLVEQGDAAPLVIQRSPADLFFIYTGGTTGLPKGVMWPQGDLRELLVGGARLVGPVPDDLPALSAHVRQVPGPRILPAPPLMHGTGLVTALNALLWGGSVVTLTGRSFDPVELLDTIERERPATLCIVGDSFGRPLLAALEASGGAHDLSSIQTITSSGVMWSLEVKRGLLRFMPGATLNDVLSSSEALGLGASVMTAGGDVPTARFQIGSRCRVLGEDGAWVVPGSGVRGQLALGPPNPVGYYKDAAKTEATFRTIDGQRYCLPGDWCTVDADGGLTFLGRGSACINTAGEKVFPEEVEEVLKRHPAIADALVVGVADDRWGEAIVAVIDPLGGGVPDEGALRDHVRAHLAGYKVPKAVVVTTAPLRAANGKADYATARTHAAAARGGA